MPSTIDLECPSCQDLLELDAGFAGGVCRCSSCGILMTVPKISGGQSEQLVRPAAPGQRASRPNYPTPSEPSPSRPKRPDSPSKSKPSTRKPAPSKQPPPAQPQLEDLPDREEIYTTASGKKLRINAARVPTASLRKTVRITTATIVITFLVLVVAGVIAFGLFLFSGSEPTPDLDREGVVVVQEETFTYSPTTNPFTLDQPHALGFPLRDHTAIVFDTSQAADGNLSALHALLTHGLANRTSTKTVSLLAATPAGPSLFLEGAVELNDLDPQALQDFLAQHPAQGDYQLDTAVQAAVAAEPDLILLVAFGNPRRHADAITAALANTDITTDILLIGGDSVTLERFIQTRDEGQLIRLPTSRFLDWHDNP